MQISVLMSVYKSEIPTYMDRALRSVWDDQTLKPDEIVLVLDGPLGNELNELITQWKNRLDTKLVTLCNETNLGLTKSLNKGLQHAKGQFIARMDSDDISSPQRFESQINYLNAHPEITIVGGSLQEFDKNNDCLNVRHYPLTPEDVKKYIYKASPLAHPAVMIRREMFTNGLKYDERFRTSQDIALWFDALCSGYQIGNIEETIIFFRRDEAVYKRRSRQKAFNEFKIYMNGIRRYYGFFTWKYIFPIARLIFRLMPIMIVKWIYNSHMRQSVLEK